MHWVHLIWVISSIFRKQVRLQLTPKHTETQCWVTKTVWQWIPGRWAKMPLQNDMTTSSPCPAMSSVTKTGYQATLTTHSGLELWSTFRCSILRKSFASNSSTGVSASTFFEAERGTPLFSARTTFLNKYNFERFLAWSKMNEANNIAALLTVS